MNAHLYRILGLLGLLIVTGCSDHTPPEVQVRAWIAAAEERAEARDASGLKDLLAGDYRDQAGRDRRQVIYIATAYFMRNQGIHLLTRIRSVDVLDADHAHAVVLVAMTGRRVVDPEALFDLRADLVRFELDLVRDGDWLLHGATWRRASKSDFIDD